MNHLKSVQINDGYHMHALCDINGRKAVMIVDTGASGTVIGTHAINRFFENKVPMYGVGRSVGLGGDNVTTFQTFVDIEIAGKIFRHAEPMIIDIAHINQSYRVLGHEAIDGVIGMDLLYKGGAVISVHDKIIIWKV